MDVRAKQAIDNTASRTDRMGGMTAADAVSNAMPMQNIVAGGPKGIVAGVAAKAIQSPAANAAGAKTLSKVSDILQSPGMQKAVAAGAPVASQTLAHGADFANPATGESALNLDTQGEQPNLTGNIMQDILSSQSPSALPAKLALIRYMNPVLGQGDPLGDQGVIQSLNTLQGANTAQSQLESLIKGYNEAGGAQGPIGGLLSQLGGLITGGPAKTYQNQADQLSQTLQQTLGHPVTLPSLTMNQDAANNVLSQLQAVLQSTGGTSVLSQLAG
jgi:hypothetical protein